MGGLLHNASSAVHSNPLQCTAYLHIAQAREQCSLGICRKNSCFTQLCSFCPDAGRSIAGAQPEWQAQRTQEEEECCGTCAGKNRTHQTKQPMLP